MPSPRIHIDQNKEIYFITITVDRWVDIFTSEKYFELLAFNLEFYRKKYYARIYGYVFMTNHIHILIQSENSIKFIQGFKSFVTKQLKILIEKDNRSYLYEFCLKGNNIFQANNWPVYIYSRKFYIQKLRYIHNNPVKKGYVLKPEDWKYSSAKDYVYGIDGSVLITRHEG